jgi:hypothetical protein
MAGRAGTALFVLGGKTVHACVKRSDQEGAKTNHACHPSHPIPIHPTQPRGKQKHKRVHRPICSACSFTGRSARGKDQCRSVMGPGSWPFTACIHLAVEGRVCLYFVMGAAVLLSVFVFVVGGGGVGAFSSRGCVCMGVAVYVSLFSNCLGGGRCFLLLLFWGGGCHSYCCYYSTLRCSVRSGVHSNNHPCMHSKLRERERASR